MMGKPGRLGHLDGLRGWAAFAVVLTHFDHALKPPLLNPASPTWFDSLLGFVFDGYLAVSIFFVLSAIVLAAALQKALEHGRPTFAGLVLKRYLRLALPMVGGCVLGFLALCVFGAPELTHLAQATGSELMAHMANCPASTAPSLIMALREGAYAAFFTREHPCYDWVLWTIKAEFIGSLAIFALILVFKAKAVRMLVSLLGLAFLADGFLGCFLVGLLLHDLGIAACSGWRASARTLDVIGMALVAFGLFAWNLADMLPGLRSAFDSIAAGARHLSWSGIPQLVQAPLIVAGCCLSPSIRRFLQKPASRFLGKISFALYLTHLPLMILIVFPLFLMLAELGVDHDAATFGLFIVVPVLLAAAAPFQRFIDQPAIGIAGRAGAFVDGAWNGCRARLKLPRKAAA